MLFKANFKNNRNWHRMQDDRPWRITYLGIKDDINGSKIYSGILPMFIFVGVKII